MIDHCHKMRALQCLEENKNTNKEMKRLLLSDSKINKDRYEKCNGGVCLSVSISLDNLCDVIMHLLFLGITKASKEMLFA